MKHIRGDHTFVYYYQRAPTGIYNGIRVGRSDATVISGASDNPERLESQGQPIRLPVGADVAIEGFLNIRRPLVETHPELAGLLSGEIRLEDVMQRDTQR